MSKKTLYSNIVPYLATLIIVTYFLTITVSILPVFTENLILTIIFLAVILICLFFLITYILYKSINAPLDHVVVYLDKTGTNNLAGDLKLEDATKEYDVLIEKVNKIVFYLRANVDQRIKSSMELQRSHEELKRAYDELKELDRLKADFIANISHELRTPLISVEGYIEYIGSGKFGKLNERQKKGIESSTVGIRRLKRLINQLLLYSRLDAKQEMLDIQPINLEEIANKVLKEYEQEAKDKKIKLTLEKNTKDIQINADGEKIKQVLLNMMDNSVKFTEKGEVKIKLDKVDNGIKVSVADTGVGIPKQYQNKLFDKFSQLDTSTSRKYGGVGLGLAVIKGLLDLHGMTINVESEENKGTTFWFTITTR